MNKLPQHITDALVNGEAVEEKVNGYWRDVVVKNEYRSNQNEKVWVQRVWVRTWLVNEHGLVCYLTYDIKQTNANSIH